MIFILFLKILDMVKTIKNLNKSEVVHLGLNWYYIILYVFVIDSKNLTKVCATILLHV